MAEKVLMKGNEAMAEAAKAVSDLAAQAQGLTNLIQELKQA